MSDPRDGCPEFDERILDSIFAPAPDAPLERHLTACEQCRRARDLYLRTADGIAGALALDEARPPATAGLRWRGRRAAPAATWAAAVAAAAILLFIGWRALTMDGVEPPGDASRNGSGVGPRASTAVHEAKSVRRYTATGEEIRVATPGGVLRCRDGVFEVSVAGGNASAPEEESPMTRGTRAAAIVTVTVAAGVVWWATNSGEVTLRAGETAARPAAGAAPAAPDAGPGPARTGAASGGAVAAHPFREPPPEPAAASSPGELEIEVLRPDGEPAAGAFVVLFRDGEVLGTAHVDVRGIAHFPACGGEVEVLAGLDSTPPLRERISGAAGRRQLRLGSGVSVSGQVEVDGGPPPADFVLTLEAEHPFAATENLPPAVRKALNSNGVSTGRTAKSASERGAFRFDGLPGDFTGRLSFPWGYVLENATAAQRTFPVPAPEDGLVVLLRRLPVVAGRVVSAGAKLPVPGARIQELMLFGSGAASTTHAADGEGRFAIVMHRPGVTRLVLEITDAAGAGLRVLSLDTGLDRGRDLGDVALSGVRELPFRVEDLAGTPIAGAVAVAGPNFQDRSAPTGADGRGVVRTTEAATVLRAAAIGHGAAEVPVPAGIGEAVVIRLPAGNSLVIRLRDADGAVPEQVMVSVTAEDPLFPRGSGMDPAVEALNGGPGVFGFKNGFDFRPGAEGRIVLAGIRPDAPFTVRAVDRLGGVLAVSTLSLGPTESRAIELRVDAVRRHLDGRVVDDLGRGLAGALLTFHTSGNLSFTTMNQDDGRFRIEDVYTDRIRISVTREGYVPARHDALPVPADGSEVRIVLEPGRKVAVRVVDLSGRPLAGVRVRAHVPGHDRLPGTDDRLWNGETGAGGVTDLKDLPVGRITIEARPAGRAYAVEHDTSTAEARIVVPAHGVLSVRLAADREPETSWRIRLEPVEAGLDRMVEALGPEPAAGRAPLRLPHVLPGRYLLYLDQHDGARQEYIASPQGVPITITAGETTETSL